MSKQQVGIYKLWKLGRADDNSFDVKHKKNLEADLHPVHHEYAEKINAQSDINGLVYELDQKATDLYWDGKRYRENQGKAKKVDTTAAATATTAATTTASTAAATDGGKTGNKPAAAGSKGKAKKQVDPELVALREEYKTVTGNEAMPIWNKGKLQKQIADEKAKQK